MPRAGAGAFAGAGEEEEEKDVSILSLSLLPLVHFEYCVMMLTKRIEQAISTHLGAML